MFRKINENMLIIGLSLILSLFIVNYMPQQIVKNEQIDLMQKENMINLENEIIISSAEMMVKPQNSQIFEATAYTHTGNPTFSGVYPRIGTIAVDPKVIPLGSRLWIEGYGYGIAQDTGGLIKGKVIDLFMNERKECIQWGRRKVMVYFLN